MLATSPEQSRGCCPTANTATWPGGLRPDPPTSHGASSKALPRPEPQLPSAGQQHRHTAVRVEVAAAALGVHDQALVQGEAGRYRQCRERA